MKLRSVLYMLVFLVLASGVSALDEEPTQEQTLAPPPFAPLEGLNGYDGEPLDTSDTENCTVSSLAFIGGQGLHISGATGGLIDDSFGPVTIDTAMSILPSLNLGDITERTALLVADDFDSSLSFNPDDLAGWIDGMAAVGQPISHGALVFHHINMLLAGSGKYHPLTPPGGAAFADWENANGDVLRVFPVSTRGSGPQAYSTRAIADNITGAIMTLSDMSDPDMGFTKFVVNMSFAVIPCVIKNDFDNSGASDFQSYMEVISANNGNIDLQVLLDSIIAAVDGTLDPLHFVTSGNGDNYFSSFYSGVDYIASSGNFGQDYSFYPAAWCEVLSVGALDIGGGTLWNEGNPAPGQPPVRLTNYAETYQPGAWYQLTDMGGRNLGQNPPLYYGGTSFAAPVESVMATASTIPELQAIAGASSWPINTICSTQRRFEAMGGETIHVTAVDANSNPAAKIEVFNDLGGHVSGTGNPGDMEFTLVNNGVYTISIFNNGTAGDFTVEIVVS